MANLLSIININFLKYKWLNFSWALGWGLFSFVIMSLFNTIADAQEGLEELFTSIPPELAAAFSADISTYTTPEGFFSSEVLTLFLVATAIFISTQTLGVFKNEHLISQVIRPVSLVKLAVANFFYLIATVLMYTAMSFLGTIIGIWVFTDLSVNFEYFFLAYLNANLLLIAFMSAVFAIRGFIAHGSTLGIAAVYPFTAIIIQGIALVDGVPEWLRYLGLFEYFDTTTILSENTIPGEDIFIMLVVTALSFAIGLWRFRKREFPT